MTDLGTPIKATVDDGGLTVASETAAAAAPSDGADSTNTQRALASARRSSARPSLGAQIKGALLDILHPLPKLGGTRSGKQADVVATYQEVPSFSDHLPTRDFDNEYGCFVMSDGCNAGALFEITPVPTEARTVEDLQRVAQAAFIAINDTLPADDSNAPWILQFYANNERSLYRAAADYEDYIRRVNPAALATEYTQAWLKEQREHLRLIADPKGIFFDRLADNAAWSGKQMRLRCTLYRQHRGSNVPSFAENAARTNDVAEAWTSALRQCGAGVRRCTSTDYVQWLMPWFSPKPPSSDGDPYDYLESLPFIDSGRPRSYEGYLTPEDLAVSDDPSGEPQDRVRRGEDLLAGYDLGDLVLDGHPVSDSAKNCWYFDGIPHRILTLQEMTVPPTVGHLTGERKIKGDSQTTLLDMMEDGSTFVMTVVVRAQHEIREYLDRLKLASRSRREESAHLRSEVDECIRANVEGNKLFHVELSVYVRGKDEEELTRRTHQTNAKLRAQGLKMIEQTHELFGIHKYLQQLPFNYDYSLDQRKTNRCRYMWASQIARLMPIYGRSRGTGNPAFVGFNRGAEPIFYDPVRDRKRNAHAMIYGPSGSGKSAYLNNAAMSLMALYRPRLFILDPKPSGGSFSHLAEYFAAHGLTVNRIRIGASKVTLNPYADALELLPIMEKQKAAQLKAFEELVEDVDEDDHVRRDPLGEMVHKTRVMITGGDLSEKIERSKLGLLQEILLDAIYAVDAENKASEAPPRQVIPSDVLLAMQRRADKDQDGELRNMASAFSLMCGTDTLAGRLFNTQGLRFQEADVTLVEFGELSREGREAELTVASMVVFDCIHAIVDKYQNEKRQTFIFNDEVHIQLKRPMLAPYIAQIVKLWRSLGAWYWPATQDFEDISQTAKSLVNNLEWLIALQMTEGDIRQLGQFRELSVEDKKILGSTSSQKGDDGIGDYNEAVVIRSPDIRLLVRSVLPAITLALAGTEKDEKALRQQLISEHGLASMLDANRLLADRIRARRESATKKIRRSWDR